MPLHLSSSTQCSSEQPSWHNEILLFFSIVHLKCNCIFKLLCNLIKSQNIIAFFHVVYVIEYYNFLNYHAFFCLQTYGQHDLISIYCSFWVILLIYQQPVVFKFVIVSEEDLVEVLWTLILLNIISFLSPHGLNRDAYLIVTNSVSQKSEQSCTTNG